ncbi:MAG: outer membrane lipoprotein chaperone LolA [Gammaproteobacteria bacterium]
MLKLKALQYVMAPITCMLISLGLAFGFSSAFAAGPSLEDLKTKLSQVSSLEAQFTQTVFNEKNKLLRKQMGNFWLKKPGLLRWERKNPKHILIIDGQHIWDYDPDLLQVVKTKINAKQHNTPMYLLFNDPNNFGKHFKLKRYFTKEDLEIFELDPNQQNQGFGWIRVSFTKKTKVLSALEFEDVLSQRILIKFSNVQHNKPISENLFKFSPPKNVDLIQN